MVGIVTPVVLPFTFITVAPVTFVPESSCVVIFVGEVTALITGAAGAAVFTVIAVVAAVLALPSASSAVTLKLFTPSTIFTTTCHVVDEGYVTPVELVFTLITAASVTFVPESSWVVIFVGEVTALITGTAGAIVSRNIAVVSAVLEFPTTSSAVTPKVFTPSARLTVTCHVVDEGNVTPVLLVFTFITAASVAFVPESSWVVIFVGEVTALITGTAGAIVSRTIAVVAAVLALPRASSAVTLKGFAPSTRLTVTCQVVDEGKVTPVELVLTLITAASVAFVPESSCVLGNVGEVTALITGTAGAVVSNNIAVVAAVLELPAASSAVTLKGFAPSTRLTVTCQVVDEGYVKPVLLVLTLITAASVAFVPESSWVVIFVGEVTALITGTAGAVVSNTIAVVAAVLALPRASSAVTLKGFAPSTRLTVTCQVVDEGYVKPVLLVFTFITAASVAFVPESSWVVIFVGEVTALITGTAGAVVSNTIAVVAAVDSFESASRAVTLKLFTPSFRLTITCQVVEEG